jgi:hypothetical protein
MVHPKIKIKMDSGFRRNDEQKMSGVGTRVRPPLEGLVARPLMSRRIADESAHRP